MTDKEKTAEILKRLCHIYMLRKSVSVKEFRWGAGYDGISKQRADLFAIDLNDGYVTRAFEIKVSRSDFLRELKDPSKQRGARLFANYFYYCAPYDLIRPEELPDWAGLIEFDLSKEYVLRNGMPCPRLGHRVVAQPAYMEREPPTWALMASALKRGCVFYDRAKNEYKISDDSEPIILETDDDAKPGQSKTLNRAREEG